MTDGSDRWPGATNWLVARMLEMRFGRLEGLHFRQGVPQKDPPPRAIWTIKPGGKNGPRRDLSAEQLSRHPKVVAFFDQLTRSDSGVVVRVVIQDCLPEVMDIEPEDQA